MDEYAIYIITFYLTRNDVDISEGFEQKLANNDQICDSRRS